MGTAGGLAFLLRGRSSTLAPWKWSQLRGDRTNNNIINAATNVMKLQHSWKKSKLHYNVIIMSAVSSQITSLTIVYSSIYSGADQRKHQSSASLAFVRGIHRWPVTRKMFPFDDAIIITVWLSMQPVKFTVKLHTPRILACITHILCACINKIEISLVCCFYINFCGISLNSIICSISFMNLGETYHLKRIKRCNMVRAWLWVQGWF